jgi:hypothetical protein
MVYEAGIQRTLKGWVPAQSMSNVQANSDTEVVNVESNTEYISISEAYLKLAGPFKCESR